jgi:hypothetical protein
MKTKTLENPRNEKCVNEIPICGRLLFHGRTCDFRVFCSERGKSIETPQTRCHVLGRRLMTFSTQKFDWKSRKIFEILTKTNSKEDCATQVQ